MSPIAIPIFDNRLFQFWKPSWLEKAASFADVIGPDYLPANILGQRRPGDSESACCNPRGDDSLRFLHLPTGRAVNQRGNRFPNPKDLSYFAILRICRMRDAAWGRYTGQYTGRFAISPSVNAVTCGAMATSYIYKTTTAESAAPSVCSRKGPRILCWLQAAKTCPSAVTITMEIRKFYRHSS